MKTFEPQVNDYVIWKGKSELDRGWVYFKCDDYITIEVGTKPKPYCSVVKDIIHCKYHCLLLCYHWDWDQLQYIKSRETNNENANTFVRTISDDRPSSNG